MSILCIILIILCIFPRGRRRRAEKNFSELSFPQPPCAGKKYPVQGNPSLRYLALRFTYEILHTSFIGVRGFLERDISSLRTVAGEGPTQKNSSRRAVAAAVVAPWKGYLGSMHKIMRIIYKTDIVS